MSNPHYTRLRKLVLANRLTDEGFTEAAGCIIKDFGECLGGIEFQRSKYDPTHFFLNAGVLSKRLDRFNRHFTTESYEQPWTLLRCQYRTRLQTELADSIHELWQLKKSTVPELAGRIATVILNDAVPFFATFSDDKTMMKRLLSNRTPKGVKLYDHNKPLLHLALVYAAVLMKEIGPVERVAEVLERAKAAAKTPMDRQDVDRWIDVMNSEPVDAEDMMPEEALQRLRELTGQDFGNDVKAWREWMERTRN